MKLLASGVVLGVSAVGLMMVSACGASSDGASSPASGGSAAGGASSGGVSAGGAADAGAASSGLMCDPEFGMPVRTSGETEDGAVGFVLDRCMYLDCPETCAVFDVDFSLRYQGRTDEAGRAQIEYSLTLANRSDALVATLPDRRLLWRRNDAGGDYLHFVAVEALDGAVILAETGIPER